MRIETVELFHVRLPLKFVFKTAKTALNYRETLVIKAVDELGNVGYGEVVSFGEPFYSEETLTTSKAILQGHYIPTVLKQRVAHPFDIHQIFDLSYPMAIAGLENALLDLYARRRGESVMQLVFDEAVKPVIDAGLALGDLEINKLLDQMAQFSAEGIRRFKIKIKPEDGPEKMRLIRQRFPGVQLLADANQSFDAAQIHRLREMDDLGLLCIEEPLDTHTLSEIAALQQSLDTPICLDESVQGMETLEEAIRLGACQVLNIKIGRVGGMYYAKQMIQKCREKGIGYWIGSMVESGISKILHVHLASLSDTCMPGDLSASMRYFKEDLIDPPIAVVEGKIRVPIGSGSGVVVNTEILQRYTIDYVKF